MGRWTPASGASDMARSRSNIKAVKFGCDTAVLGRLDAYTHRHRSRTAIIERAIIEYLDRLEASGEGPSGWIVRS